MERVFVSISKTTKILGLGRTNLYRMMGEGQLATVKLGRRRLVKVEAIRRLLDGGDQPHSSQLAGQQLQESCPVGPQETNPRSRSQRR